MSLGHRVPKLVADHGNCSTAKATHWERVSLGDIAAVVNGYPFPSNGFNSEQGSPVLRIRDVLPGKVGTYYNGPTDEAPCIQAGELVVGMDGNFNSRIWPGEKAFLNQRVCKVLPKEMFYSNRLLSYVLPGYLKLINEHTSAVTVKHLSSKDIEDVPLPLPPRNEQDRLVSKIDELFSSIDEGERALERVRKLVERYRQSVLKAAVTGELTREWREQHAGELESGEALLTRILESRRQAWEQSELARMTAKGVRPSDNAWKKKYVSPASINASRLPNVPTGWVWARAEQICGFITKGTTPAPSAMSPGVGEVPYIKVYNLTFSGNLDFTKDPTYISQSTHMDELNRSRVVPGDVLMNIVGPPLGKVSIVPDTYPEWNMNQAIAVFKPLQGVDQQFLAFYLLSRAAQDWYKTKAKATAGQFNLTLEICRDTPIPLPSLLEQIAIRELLKVEFSRDANLSSTLKHESMRSSALKQSVLSAAFSGQLVPQDPMDEPASVLLERIAAERAATPKRTASKQVRAKKTKSKSKP